MEAVEARVAYVQQAVAKADGVMAELRGRLEAAERDAAESRAQVMRVEAAAQVAVVGARDSFEQIQQRIGIEQGSDARRLDQLSAEIARLTREVADNRGEEASKRQALEAVIARLEGQVNVDNSLIGALRDADAETVQAAAEQFGDVRRKMLATEDVVRTLTEQLQEERRARTEAEARTEATIQRIEELGNQREQSVMRRFEHELEQKVSELARRVVDESEGAAERDQAIVREKDEQMSAFQKGSQKERQKNIEHMLVVEKAIREERTQRVNAVSVITKSIDRVNRDVTGLLRDEKAAREAREGKLRGQISQSVLKLHAANKETKRKLEEERDGINKVLKTEIRARMTSVEQLTKAMNVADKEHDRRLAAGRVEAAQALRSAEVKLSRRLTATEGRVEVEVAALRKLYARQTQLEKDMDAFKADVREAFELIQDDLTSAAVAQALNTETDNVNGEILQVTVKDLNDRLDRQDARDREKASMLEAAVSVLGEGQSGLRVRADKTEQDVSDIFDALVADERARAKLEKAIERVAAKGAEEAEMRAQDDLDIKAALAEEAAVRAAFDAHETARVNELEMRADGIDARLDVVDENLESLQDDIDNNAVSSVLQCETLKAEIDQAAVERGDNAEAAERIAERQTFVEERVGELRGDLVEGIEAVRTELDAAAEDLRDAVAKESDARVEALGALEARVVEASVKSRAEVDEAHNNLRRAINAEVGARERAAAELHDRLDDETEARLADGAAFQEITLEETRDRERAVAALWTALEENYVAQQLEAECARIDAEEFSVAQVDEWRAAIGEEKTARDAALVELRAHVAACVEDEAKARERGDDDVRRAYEDDIANLEDTASEAVRELRAGLRTEITERRHQAETLHRDLGDALDAARSRLERDVRALEETAASNIAAQKLEEEMLRAELDDGMLRVEEALEALQENADANAARSRDFVASATAEVKGLVAAGVAPVDAKLEQLAEAVEGGMSNLEASIEKEVAARHDYAKAAQEVFDQMQDGISVGMQAMNAKMEESIVAQAMSAEEELNQLKSAIAESLESTNVAVESAFDEVHRDMSKLEAEVADVAVSAIAAEEATRVELEMMVDARVRQEGQVREAGLEELATTLRSELENDAAALDDLRQEIEQDREMQGEEMKGIAMRLDDLERDTAEAIAGAEEKCRADVAAEASARVLVENEIRGEIAKEGAARVAAGITAAEETAKAKEELSGKMRDLQLAVREEFDSYTAQVMLDMEAQRTDLEEKMIDSERAAGDAADEIRAAMTEAEESAAAASDALREELTAALDAEAKRTNEAIDSEAALRENLAAQLNEARANIADTMEVERGNTLEALTRVEENIAAEAKTRAEAIEVEARERQDLAAELGSNLDDVAADAKTDVETLRTELMSEISDAAAAAAAATEEAAAAAEDRLVAATEEITAAAAEELAAESSAMREEMVQTERRVREEYTAALQGEAEMREKGDVAAAEGRAGLTGSIEEDRKTMGEAIVKLQTDLAAEAEARRSADEQAIADATTREETLRTEVFSAVDELDARAAVNLENESKARKEALEAAATALETVTAASAEAVTELATEIDAKIDATKDEVLQLIAGEAEERAKAIKQAVDVEAAERKEADEGLDQSIVQSLAHEIEERTGAVDAVRAELGADIKAESETLRAALTQHADEAVETAAVTAAAAAAAVGASVANEVTARSEAIEELRGVIKDGLGLTADGRDQLKTAIEQEAETLREEIAAARKASEDAVAGEAAARGEGIAAETKAREEAVAEEAKAREEAVAAEAAARGEAVAGESKAREEAIAAEAAAREEAATALATEGAMKSELATLQEDLEGKLRDAAAANAGRDDEILQLITKETAERETAIKTAVEAEAAERVKGDETADQNLVDSLAREMGERQKLEAAAETLKSDLAALDERVVAESKARDETIAALREEVGHGREATEAAISAAVGEEAAMRKGELEAEAAARTEALDDAANALKSVADTQANALAKEAEAREKAIEELNSATTKKMADVDAANTAAREELKATIAEGLKLSSETRDALKENLAAEATARQQAVDHLTAAVDAEVRERREAVSKAQTEADENIKSAVAELESELKPKIEANESSVAAVQEKVTNAAASAGEAKAEVDAIRGELVEFQNSITEDTADLIDKRLEAKQYVTMVDVGEALAGLDQQIVNEAKDRKKQTEELQAKVDENLDNKLTALETKIKELSASATAAATTTPAASAAQESSVTAAAGIAERAAVSAAEAKASLEAAKADVASLSQKFEKLKEDHEALIATEKENAKQDAMMTERFNSLVKDVERIEKEGREVAEKIVTEKLAKSQDELKSEINKGQEATGAALQQILGKLNA